MSDPIAKSRQVLQVAAHRIRPSFAVFACSSSCRRFRRTTRIAADSNRPGAELNQSLRSCTQIGKSVRFAQANGAGAKEPGEIDGKSRKNTRFPAETGSTSPWP
jgi:hypothetical protein